MDRVLPDDDITRGIKTMCDNARRVKALCDALGFEFRGADRLIQHLDSYTIEDVAPITGHPDVVATMEDPDLRPYIWEM